MTRRTKIWTAVAVIFTLVNVAGLGMAAAAAEPFHAGVHVLLAMVGAYFTWRLIARAEPAAFQNASQTSDRLQNLQQSIDAIALEVERIGEAQRFNAKIEAERIEKRQ